MEVNRTVYAKAPGVKATAELVIKDFVEVVKTSKTGKSYSSDTFMVGDTPMKIHLYPNGYRGANKGYVSVVVGNMSNAALNVKCQLISEKCTKGFDLEVRANSGRLIFDFLSHAECTEAYKDKDFVLTANVEIPGEDLKIMGNEDAVVRKKYCLCKNLYEKMQNSDFTFVFNGVEVPCHKIVLAAASPVFEAMVRNQHREAIESKANIELTEEVGRAFIKYIYVGALQKNILEEQAAAFLELGNKYDMQELKDLAEAELLRQLDKKNMVEFVSFGDIFNAKKLFETALKMTKANMSWLRSQVYAKTK